MRYAENSRVVWVSPRGVARMMDAIVVACQDFGLTVSEKKIEAFVVRS